MRLQKELNSLSPRNVVAVLVAESGGMEGDPSAGGGFRAHAGSPGLNEHHTYDLGGTGAGAAAAASAAAVAAGGTISKVTLLLSPRSKEQSFWQSVRYVWLSINAAVAPVVAASAARPTHTHPATVVLVKRSPLAPCPQPVCVCHPNNNHLGLLPPSLPPALRRVLKLLDGLGLFYSAMLNVMLIRKFGWGHNHPDWLWHFLPVVAYLAASSLQLCLLVSKPDAYHRHRFVINLANRLVKAATVTWAAVNMSQNTVMVQFTATLNSVPHAAPGEHSAATYMKILRTVASLPMLWVSHCINFLLPFWLIFPFQVFTLLAVSRVMPSIVCALLAQPDHIIQAALAIATHVQAVVRVLISVALPLPMRWPWDFPPTPDTVAKDLLMLVAVTFTMVGEFACTVWILLAEVCTFDHTCLSASLVCCLNYVS